MKLLILPSQDKKQLEQERVSFIIRLTVHRWGKLGQVLKELKAGRNLETATEAKAVVECCFSACFPESLFSYAIQEHLLSGVTPWNNLGPIMPIINQENALQSCLQAKQMGAFSSEISFPKWL